MGFFDKLKESASRATDKAKDSVEVVRLGSQISAKRKEIEKQYISIGEAVFQANQNDELNTVKDLIADACSQIVNYNQEIDQLEQKIKVLKDEKDCVCGNTLPISAKFCSNCGHKFEAPEENPILEEVKTEEDSQPALLNESNASEAVRQCPSCREAIGTDDHFCESCGTKID